MRPLIRLAAVALALTLGAFVGLATSYFFRPSDAEIRSAVRSLVPPGVVVDGEGHGKPGGTIIPVFEPYIAVVSTRGGPANPDDRVDLFRQHAEANGWREVSRDTQRSQNSVLAEYVRNGIRGRVGLSLNHPLTSLDTTRDSAATTRRRVTGGSIGAVTGVAVWLGLLLLRRSSDQRP